MTSTYNSKTAVQYHMTPIYNSTLPYIHRSAPKSHTFLTALRSTLAARDLYCTPGTSINCPDISTLCRRYIYFLCGIYSIRTSMVTCCDYIYILWDTYIMNDTERPFFGEARAPQGQGLSALSVFVLFCVFFSFHGRL